MEIIGSKGVSNWEERCDNLGIKVETIGKKGGNFRNTVEEFGTRLSKSGNNWELKCDKLG